MSSPMFTVRSVFTDEESFTNLVYMNPMDIKIYLRDTNVVLISDFPFTVASNALVESGFIAMNGLQRRLLRLSTAAGSTVTLTKPPQQFSAITKMTVMLEHIAASKKGGNVDCMQLISDFSSQYAKQYFRETQMLGIVAGPNMRLMATVVALECSDSGVPIGYIADTTSIIFCIKEKSEISLLNLPDNQLDAQQQQLLQNFDLENLGIGGLRSEFAQVFRRAFASRLFPASYVKKLGIKHVKGVLLYGPPGTGKTLIARKIGEILNCYPPKIVNGPEVFNKYVGGTEENVRKLFVDAEAEAAAKGDLSQLHLIIFDEFDAICKQRGAVRDSTGVNDNVVNQLLSKIDGVDALNNVLLIGMTNRLDLIDDAILRPGRFEVHVEISLPNEQGRQEIFRIHTRGMRDNGVIGRDVDVAELASLTRNYSGAEIEGVVRSATSIAFNRHINLDNPTEFVDTKDVFVMRQDFLNAIEEIKPAFGQAKEECGNLKPCGIIDYGERWQEVYGHCDRYVRQLKEDGKRIQSLSVLIEGLPGAGKSAVAAQLAEMAGFPYVKVISSESMVGYGEMQKVNIIRKAFEDAYRSPASVIILDNIERILEFSHLGGRYSNAILQALLVLIKKPSEENKKLLVLGTTSLFDILDSLEVVSCFSARLPIPTVPSDGLLRITEHLGIRFRSDEDERKCVNCFPITMPIKQLLLVLDMATDQMDDGGRVMKYESFLEALKSVGAHTF